MLESRFHALSLGQGQAPFATRMLKEGIHEVLYIMFQCLIVTLSCLNQCQQQALFVSRCVVNVSMSYCHSELFESVSTTGPVCK